MSVLSASYGSSTSRRRIVQSVPPPAGSEPLSPADLKQHLRISDSEEDTLLAAYLAAGRRWAETFTRRQFVRAEWQLRMDCFPEWELRLPRPPLISVSSIVYLDSAGTSQTLAADLYTVDRFAEPGVIVPAYGQTWPTVQDGTPNAVVVTYLAGYGAMTKTRLDLASVLAGQTITINDLVFTAHAATTTASAREFAISGSNAADATELAALINNATYGVPNVAAAASGARITLTPQPGTTVTATPSAATMTVSTNVECTLADSIAAVPETIKAALKLLVGHWYENREPYLTTGANVIAVPLTIETLLWGERVLEFG